MVQRLWFQQSIEGLFLRGVGRDMTPALRQELLALGIDLTHLQPGYAVETVTRAIRRTAAALFPTVSEGTGVREVGRLFLRGYAETLMGAAMVQVMRVVGTRRSLERMQRNFRSGGNYLETRFTSLGPGRAELWVNDVSGVPEFYVGLFEKGGELAGAKNLRLHFTPSSTDLSCTFLVEWDE